LVSRTWTATDASGNTATTIQKIYLRDQLVPIAVPKNITVSVGTANVTLPASGINNGSSDNCTTAPALAICNGAACTNFAASLTLTKTMGVYTVPNTAVVLPMRLRVTDACGNISYATANVSLIRTAPLANNNTPTLYGSETADSNIAPTSTELATPSDVDAAHGSMKCFPNPFSDDLNIKYNLTSDVNRLVVKVYDIQGKLVSSTDQGESLAGYYQMRWNLSNLQAGMYNICLELDGKCQKVQRVVLVK
jgi:hypothetical protein